MLLNLTIRSWVTSLKCVRVRRVYLMFDKWKISLTLSFINAAMSTSKSYFEWKMMIYSGVFWISPFQTEMNLILKWIASRILNITIRDAIQFLLFKWDSLPFEAMMIFWILLNGWTFFQSRISESLLCAQLPYLP